MKKFRLNIFIIIFCTFLSCGLVFCEPVTQNVPATQQSTVQTTETEEIIPETIPEKNYENLMKIKDSATTSKNFSVFIWILTGLTILLGLLGLFKFYRNWKEKNYIIETTPKETLATPKDFNSAINLFLGKTDE